ncbi:MAG TPA: 5-(carboxyamino)imidazole ribonucleotide synthase [Steroidobacteraceae bacterium]|jgi:5-(carboxyamino)imidazole ribonucleotide synthase|nr:5-(carboxyamino)imidazole ribonucleotide synthase [Steroidobacteraceae bacterium]
MRIGIVGAGQLGRMMALAGIPLGLEFTMYDRSADVPGAAVADVVTGRFDDLRALARFARGVDVVTFDWENVPAASVRAIARIRPVWPPPRALEAAQDRLSEKRLFTKLGIPVAPYAAVDSREGLERAIAAIGLPGILKTRRLGYDGKGQARIRRARDAGDAFELLGGQPLVYERFVDFTREVSLVAARGRDGDVACYPLAENEHAGGILSVTRAPFVDARLQRAAERNHRRLFRALGYVGVLCVEYFVERGRLVANEMAPRVHNSGHWSIEGAETSQFENHVRAVAGLPLGSTALRGHAAMVNVIGRKPGAAGLLRLPGLHWHDYGKAPRPGRKLGHVTFVTASRGRRDRVARQLRRRLKSLT